MLQNACGLSCRSCVSIYSDGKFYCGEQNEFHVACRAYMWPYANSAGFRRRLFDLLFTDLCSQGPMFRRQGPMFRRFNVQKVLCSEGPLFRRSFVQKVQCLEGSVFRRFYVQKVL